MTTEHEPFDLRHTFVHLGLGAVAFELPDFQWSAEYLAEYVERTKTDGPDGRLVTVSPQEQSWTMWERHPAGDEVVVQLSGRVVVIQDTPAGERRLEVGAGQALINHKGVWHTADVIEPGETLFITPGVGTEHRPR
jgi:mannose-6-phosphate isomerase-like protein (cupin superfamily)